MQYKRDYLYDYFPYTSERAKRKNVCCDYSTLLGTFISLFMTYFVLWLTSEKGLRYEELQFITRPYKLVFLAGLFLGSLGAVMDVAITMSSSIFGLYEKNNNISVKALIKSGREIGKDIIITIHLLVEKNCTKLD
nr:YibE/F family protein [Niallia alba]